MSIGRDIRRRSSLDEPATCRVGHRGRAKGTLKAAPVLEGRLKTVVADEEGTSLYLAGARVAIQGHSDSVQGTQPRGYI